MKELYTFTKNRVVSGNASVRSAIMVQELTGSLSQHKASGEDNSSMVYKLLVRTVESNTQHEEEIVIPIAAVAAEGQFDLQSVNCWRGQSLSSNCMIR